MRMRLRRLKVVSTCAAGTIDGKIGRRMREGCNDGTNAIRCDASATATA